MDKTLSVKILAAAVLVCAFTALALGGKIDGATATNGITWVGVTFLGGAALLSVGNSIGAALAPATTVTASVTSTPVSAAPPATVEAAPPPLPAPPSAPVPTPEQVAAAQAILAAAPKPVAS